MENNIIKEQPYGNWFLPKTHVFFLFSKLQYTCTLKNQRDQGEFRAAYDEKLGDQQEQCIGNH